MTQTDPRVIAIRRLIERAEADNPSTLTDKEWCELTQLANTIETEEPAKAK